MDELTLPYDILRFDYKERLDDRFLTTHLHRFEAFHRPVAIAVVLEVLNPWHPTSELGQKIINNLVRGFLRSESQSFLTRFEDSLKFANRTVEEALAKLNTPVSCVVLLIEEDQVHCAGIGRTKLGLFRNGKFATILGAKSPSVGSFSSVTSGDMLEGDWICMSNEDFFELFESVTTDLWQEADISNLANYIVSQKDDANKARWAGILLRFNRTGEVVNQTTLWEESDRSPGFNLPKVAFGQTGGNFFKSVSGRLTATAQNLTSQFKPIAKQAISTLNNRLRLAIRTKSGQIALASTAAILLITPILVYQSVHHDPRATVVHDNLLAKINALNPDPFNKGWLANFKLADYQALNDSERSQLTAMMLARGISLTDLPAATTQMPNNIIALDVFDSKVALIDNQGQIWIYKNGLLNKIEQNQPISNPQTIAAFGETNIVVSDTQGNIWYLDGSAASPIALIAPKEIPLGVKNVTGYKNNLYITSLESKVVYRVLNFSGSLTGALTYSSGSNLPLGSIADLAINGTLIAVDSDGHVVNFSRNKLSDINLNLGHSDGVFRLAANEKSTTIAVISGRLISLINSQGAIEKTLFVLSDDKIADAVIDPDLTNTLWLVIGSQLYHLTTT